MTNRGDSIDAQAYQEAISWRETIFGEDPPMQYWRDYQTVAPACVTLERFRAHESSERLHASPSLERLSIVMVHQAIYKRRFWSKKTLVRLLQHFVMYVCVDMDREGRFIFPRGQRLRDCYENCNFTQSRLDGDLQSFLLPPMRMVPKTTLRPKLHYMCAKMKADFDSAMESGQFDHTRFIDLWMDRARDMNFLPKRWFSWHNDEFDEVYEYPHCDHNFDFGLWKLELINE